MVLLGVTLLLFFLLRDKKGESVVVRSTNCTNDTETSITWEGHIQSLLPVYTLAAIQSEDAETPQYLAYQWTLNDTTAPTGNSNYSDWQIVQRFALATIYYATDGDAWFNNTNWLDHDVDECQWFSKGGYGQYCSECYQDSKPCNDDGIFQHLWLRQNYLQHKLPPELFLLTDLLSVSLYQNQLLDATLSTLIGHLQSLEALSLGNTGLSGSIPSELGTLSNLFSLNLVRNRLTGLIPTELGRLFQLNNLLLDSNVSDIQ